MAPSGHNSQPWFVKILETNKQIIAKTSFDVGIIEVALTESKPEDYPLKRITQRMTAKQGYLPHEIKKEERMPLSTATG
jgi:hypothetical protein